MTKSKSEFSQRMNYFKNRCRESNIKITHQRLEIFSELIDSQDHPHAELIFQRVKKRVPTISLDTVYRALWIFADLGLINTIGASRARARFDANLKKHHHIICEKCSSMTDFYSKDFNELTLPDSITEKIHAPFTHVEVRGICKKCSKNKP